MKSNHSKENKNKEIIDKVKSSKNENFSILPYKNNQDRTKLIILNVIIKHVKSQLITDFSSHSQNTMSNASRKHNSEDIFSEFSAKNQLPLNLFMKKIGILLTIESLMKNEPEKMTKKDFLEIIYKAFENEISKFCDFANIFYETKQKFQNFSDENSQKEEKKLAAGNRKTTSKDAKCKKDSKNLNFDALYDKNDQRKRKSKCTVKDLKKLQDMIDQFMGIDENLEISQIEDTENNEKQAEDDEILDFDVIASLRPGTVYFEKRTQKFIVTPCKNQISETKNIGSGSFNNTMNDKQIKNIPNQQVVKKKIADQHDKKEINFSNMKKIIKMTNKIQF
ncbi:hypothetical protein EDEG_02464 [Edhazardia aedis USNM 41457]|uniref:Uncharacterized protein n=1 Tax=Edhazardia aedis (strain USNM 41457) TaxID=1003232 RepID=J9D6L6_EDHAE|nr:hypothetical protein EDEG_02464 [Edhazardia aedis USNM 41457]|eukprot:EJW03159.1 hypothetical protein EDEG_02464 [Edhazardia aedis USNM 41457]